MKTFTPKETEGLFLQRKLNLQRDDMNYPFGKRILLRLINSGSKLSKLEKQLSKQYLLGKL